MGDLETLLKDIKNPRNMALSVITVLFCMILGYFRGSIGGLIIGILVGGFLSLAGIFLIYKHEEKQKEIEESLIIPKIGMTERKEQWLRKKKMREVKAEKRVDLVIKIVWWIIFVIIGLNILYWISPIIYYTLQAAKR
jgi:hypothetical protein